MDATDGKKNTPGLKKKQTEKTTILVLGVLLVYRSPWETSSGVQEFPVKNTSVRGEAFLRADGLGRQLVCLRCLRFVFCVRLTVMSPDLRSDLGSDSQGCSVQFCYMGIID